jgi:hypothetical protein
MLKPIIKSVTSYNSFLIAASICGAGVGLLTLGPYVGPIGDALYSFIHEFWYSCPYVNIPPSAPGSRGIGAADHINASEASHEA